MLRPFIIALLLTTSPLSWASLSVISSDTEILLTDQIRVEIELDRASDSTPNLTRLSNDFSVLSLEKMVLGQANRDHTDYRTRWYLNLRPRRTGELRIPEFTIDGLRSAPLSILVSADPNQPLISSTVSLSPPPHLTDQAIILEVQARHSRPLPEATSFRPKMNDHQQIRLLSDLKSIKTDDHWESLQRFALYTSMAGTQATPAFELINHQGELITEIPSEIIEVQPAAYQTERGRWLPAERLTLEDSWQDLKVAKPGQTLQRTLTLSAIGPLAIQLPELPLPPGFRLVDVQIDETSDPFGVQSTRTETWEIDTEQRTNLQTLATEIPWWDSQDRTTRILTIPARSLLIEHPSPEPVIAAAPLLSNAQIQTLGIAGLASFLGLIFAGLRLYQLRRRTNREIEQLQVEQQQLRSEVSEMGLFLRLLQACERNQAEAASGLLIAWIRYVWTDIDVDNLDALCLQSGDSQFNLILFQLMDHLSHPEESDWDGESLALQLKTLRRRYLATDSDDLTETGARVL